METWHRLRITIVFRRLFNYEQCAQSMRCLDETDDLMVFVTEPIATPEELKKWVLIAFAFAIPLYILLALIGQANPGFPAAIAVYMVVLNAGMFWRSRGMSISGLR